MTDHYTAVIEVTHTSEAKSAPAGSRPSYDKTADTPRKKKDIARIVVRAESIDKLVDKLGAHVALLEDYEVEDLRKAAS